MSEPREETAKSVVRACEVLKAFRFEGELLRLRDFSGRCTYSKTTVFRLLHSLVQGGLVERVGRGQYRSLVKPARAAKYRIGFAAPSTGSSFGAVVTESVKRAAEEAGVDLFIVNNHQSPTVALRNAERLTNSAVDIVIEFQVQYRVASAVAAHFMDAGIPVIAIDVPHPGAEYYGADNYRAGSLAGQGLADWTKRVWEGQFDEILLLCENPAGPLTRLRLTGAIATLQKNLRAFSRAAAVEFDGKGQVGAAFEAVRRHLRLAAPKRTLVVATNDPMAIGALRAFDEVGRIELCAVVGQNAEPEARDELRRPGTRLIGSVAYFPERYGFEVIPMALDVLSHRPHRPARYVKHVLVTPDNVNEVYPLDKQVPDWMNRILTISRPEEDR